MVDEESSLDVSANGLLLATAGILIFAAALWVGPLITDSLRVQAAIVGALVVTLGIASVVASQRRTKRRRVLAIFFAWVAMTMTFAIVYAITYSFTPTSFRANRDLYDVGTRKQLNSTMPKLRNTLAQLYRVNLVDASAARVAAMLTHGGAREVALTPDVSFSISQEIHQRAGSDPMHPTLAATYRVTWREGHTIVPMVHTYSGLEIDPGNRFIEAIGDARNVASVHAAIVPYRAFLESRVARLDGTTRALLTQGVSLDISHFIFMSSSISTTIGSADVTPNSTTTRYLVVLQGFCSVFLFGYAAQTFWT